MVASEEQLYKYNGKELDAMRGLNWYDYSARHYDPAIACFSSIDPMAEKYYSISPYAYVNNNPLKYIDKDGRSYTNHIDVTKNSDGTYTVVGGQANSDKSIYVVDNSGKRTGEIVGQMLTEYSFHGENGSAIKGAVINPRDVSGQSFIDNDIKGKSPFILYYMAKARNFSHYDFKDRGKPNSKINTIYHYRGMPFKDSNGGMVYASARDLGNYGAGYISGKTGMGWMMSRIGFDAYQSYSITELVAEGMPTQKAERLGHNGGSQQYPLRQLSNWFARLFNWPVTEPEGYKDAIFAPINK